MGHIISRDGIAIDSEKAVAAMQAPAPINPKECMRFLGQIHWHGRHMRVLAHLAIPLNTVAHIDRKEIHVDRKEFSWTKECDSAYA